MGHRRVGDQSDCEAGGEKENPDVTEQEDLERQQLEDDEEDTEGHRIRRGRSNVPMAVEDDEEDTEGHRRRGRAGATRMVIGGDDDDDTEGNRFVK
jgi:hypothetical protein